MKPKNVTDEEVRQSWRAEKNEKLRKLLIAFVKEENPIAKEELAEDVSKSLAEIFTNFQETEEYLKKQNDQRISIEKALEIIEELKATKTDVVEPKLMQGLVEALSNLIAIVQETQVHVKSLRDDRDEEFGSLKDLIINKIDMVDSDVFKTSAEIYRKIEKSHGDIAEKLDKQDEKLDKHKKILVELQDSSSKGSGGSRIMATSNRTTG